MKKSFILYRILETPDCETAVIYVKEMRAKKPVFTVAKHEAMRTGLLDAVNLSLRHRLSRLPEKFIL